MINRKQLYTKSKSDQFKMEEIINKMRHFTVITDLNVA